MGQEALSSHGIYRKAAVKAVVIRRFGSPDVLELDDVAMPAVGDGEVLIQVHAVSVNRTLDLVVREGKYARPVVLPHVLGADPSGVIVAIGPRVTTRKVGDRVATSPRVRPATAEHGPALLGVQVWGGYAEYVALPAANTYVVPPNVDFPTATVVARHAPPAFHLLREKAKVAEGEWVLVMGAAGGLGSAGVQAAKYLGARVVAGAGSEARVDAALRLGADAGVNYRAKDLYQEVMRVTEGRGVNVVFENIADPILFPKALACLARYGRLVTAGAHGGGRVELDMHRVYLNQLAILGSTDQTPADVDLALKAAAEGRFSVLISRVLPLSQAALAHELAADPATTGKIVLAPL